MHGYMQAEELDRLGSKLGYMTLQQIHNCIYNVGLPTWLALYLQRTAHEHLLSKLYKMVGFR